MNIEVGNSLVIDESELEFSAIRAQGKGGQNVNKVSSAIHLRFDIKRSSLPEVYQQRLLQLSDQRISKDGVIVIKAQQFRTQEKNREAAIARLVELIAQVLYSPKKRLATKPSKGAQRRRLESKAKKGEVKAARGKVDY